MSILKLRDFSFELDDEIIFDTVSLEIGAHQSVCIETDVLDGGSSLLKCLAGICQPTAGEITLKDKPIHLMQDSERIKAILYCYEHGGMISTFSNYNNIAFPILYNGILKKSQIKKRIYEIAVPLGLEPILLLEPHQLNDVQTRLVHLTRCLCINPQVILLDEIQTGMSEETIDNMIRVIKQIQSVSGFTFIMTITDGDKMEFADRVLKIQDKKLLG